MVITAVAVGTRGDVNPLAELGEEMIKRGHEFRILTSEAFRPLIESKGVTYLKLDTEADHVMQYLVAEYKTSIDFMKGMFRLKKENPGFMEQTVSAIRGSDLVMYGTCGAFAYHAAECLKIPCARVFYSPMDPTSRVLMKPDPTWGDHIHVTGYWYHPDEAIDKYQPQEDLLKFLNSGEKPIFVAFGKAESKELAELQIRVLLALKETGIRAVIQADQIPKSDRVNTDQLYFIENVPYSYIFGKVRAVVHHGGNTTNGLGLRAGLPTLVIPLALDQYFYGRMDHRIGAGPAPLYIRKRLCTVDEIEGSLNDLISGKYDKGALEASKTILKENGVIEAADAIEAYINEV